MILSCLIARRLFSSGVWTFFLGFAFDFVVFLRALVDLAFVLGLDLDLVVFEDVDFFAAAFLGTLAATADVESEADATALEAVFLFRGVLVVRPVWAFGLDTAFVAYDLHPTDGVWAKAIAAVTCWLAEWCCCAGATRAMLKAREGVIRLLRHCELNNVRWPRAR